MKIMKRLIGLICVVFLIVLLSKNSQTSMLQSFITVSKTDPTIDYIENLAQQRDHCHSAILYLGITAAEDLPDTLAELEKYLQKIRQLKLRIDDKENPLYELITIDENLVVNAVEAIQSQDEDYLTDIRKLYRKFQQTLKKMEDIT